MTSGRLSLALCLFCGPCRTWSHCPHPMPPQPWGWKWLLDQIFQEDFSEDERWCCWPRTTHAAGVAAHHAPPPQVGLPVAHLPPPPGPSPNPRASLLGELRIPASLQSSIRTGRRERSTGKGVPIPRFRPGCPPYCVGPWAGPGVSRAEVFTCGDGKTREWAPEVKRGRSGSYSAPHGHREENLPGLCPISGRSRGPSRPALNKAVTPSAHSHHMASGKRCWPVLQEHPELFAGPRHISAVCRAQPFSLTGAGRTCNDPQSVQVLGPALG